MSCPGPSYATQSDVYKFGLPRGALGAPGQLVASSLAATSTIELDQHGFVSGDAVLFRATANGVLSSPLVEAQTYYVLYVTDSTFQVSATPNGSPITLTTDGVSMLVVASLPFEDVLNFYSRFVDGFLPAEVVPLDSPYPITVVAIVAELTAKKIQILSGVKSGSMDEAEIAAGAQLKRWSAGLPVRDAAVTQQPANTAVTTRVCNDRIGTPLYGYGPGGLWTGGKGWE